MTRNEWRPDATLETLKARADLLARIRRFFAERGVLEVDTPLLSRHATVDRHIESFEVAGTAQEEAWLHTSPEFAMKRLLAAGSGPIYQLCHVFRTEESGRLHNPEFMMLEWYRPGWDHHRLMDEVEALGRAVGIPANESFERMTYQAAFAAHAGLDPHRSDLRLLQSRLQDHGCVPPERMTPEEAADRDFWLDLWMSAVVGPRLGRQAPCFVYDFPASQAALARVQPGDPPVAERFELFWRGMELANGFHELTDAAEQRQRFKADQAWRGKHGRKVPPFDEHLLAALEAGMPDSAGVALGVDRLLMLMLDLPGVAQAMAFAIDRA